MKKKIPTFKSDRAAAAFVEKADLTQYDLSGAQLTRFEIKPKDKSINLRLSEELYEAVCVFRSKPAIDSDASRPPVPTERGH